MVKSDLVNELFQSTIRYPKKLALASYNGSFTYSELWHSVTEVSKKLHSIGVGPGDRVVFSHNNNLDFIILHFAVLKIRAISVPIDMTISEANFDSIIENVNPVVILADRNWKKNILNDKKLFVDISEFLSNYNIDIQKEIEHYEYQDNTSKNLAVILFTSGSTGVPKGVMLSHANTIHTVRNIINFCSYNQNCTELVTLPLTHSFGLGQVYSMLFSGGSAFIESGMLRMKRIFKAMDDFHITGFPTTPKGVDLIINQYSEIFKNKGKDIKTIVVNSAPLMPNQTEELQKILPNSKIYVYYGLTEASRSSFACLTDLGPKMYSSVGKAMNSVDISIDNTSGEIIISGPTVSVGYWPNELFKTSSNNYPKLASGDIGRFDNDNNLYITGRIKDQINIGGFKVDPFEVEKVVKKFNQIKDIAVVGNITNDGEQVVYFIVPSDLENFNETDLRNYCRGKIEHYKMPSKIIVIEKLPEGVNGKINRKQLLELIKSC